MNGLFTQIVGNKPKRNAFDLSHERKFSMNMGELIPVLCEEVIPGDTFRLNTEILIRFAPMLAPVMHRINVYTHYFFVPNRLIWDDWEEFITGGRTGEDPEPEMPAFTLNNGDSIVNGSLADYLGFATASSGSLPVPAKINALPFRAYLEIYNEYYRDQNLEEEVPNSKNSGNTASQELVKVRTRAWEKDYFTSALPWTQRGGDVSLPLGGKANVVLSQDGTSVNLLDEGGNPLPTVGNLEATSVPPDIKMNVVGDPLRSIQIDPNGTLEADMSTVTATTIEELRKATKLQQWLERNARGGARYIEQILSHFGVKSSDARLQRPEYLGGGKSPVTISEVLQTSGTQKVGGEVIDETPLAEMGGHGIAVGNTHRFKRFFEEHGYVIGIISVIPKTAYMQGTRKQHLKEDKFDYFFPEFAQLGEQPIDIRELYQDYSKTEPQTFGYQSRYAEYKYIPSTVHGDFKDSLSYWHMARDFENEPALNNDFVKSENIERIFNVTTEEGQPPVPKLWVQVYHNLKAIRPIPKFNNPSLL